MSVTVNLLSVTDTSRYQVLVENNTISVHEFKQLLRGNALTFLERLNAPLKIMKLSLEDGPVLKDNQSLESYELSDFRQVILCLEEPKEEIPCPQCSKAFDLSQLDRMPHALSCGHAICGECLFSEAVQWEDLLADVPLKATDPSLLLERDREPQQQKISKNAEENGQRANEREKSEFVRKIKCCVSGCCMTSYCSKNREWPIHESMKQLLHLKQMEWTRAEESRQMCSLCHDRAMFELDGCNGHKYCAKHCWEVLQGSAFAEKTARYIEATTMSANIEVSSGDLDPNWNITATRPTEKETVALATIQQSNRGLLQEQNDLMNQLQQRRVDDVKIIGSTFDRFISELLARKDAMIKAAKQKYSRKEMQLLEQMHVCAMESASLEAILLTHREVTGRFSLTANVEGCQERAAALRADAAKRFKSTEWRRVPFAFPETEDFLKEFGVFADVGGQDPVSIRGLRETVSAKQREIESLRKRLTEATEQGSSAQSNLEHSNREQEKWKRAHDTMVGPLKCLTQPILGQFSNEEGMTLLHYFVEVDELSMVAFLIKSCAGWNFIDATTKDNRTPLFIAASRGNVPMTKLLLLHHAAVDIKSTDGLSALHAATIAGNSEVVRMLLENGADLNGEMVTPLHLAVKHGHVEIVRELLKRRLNVDCEMEDGASPLFLASENGHEEIVRLLLSKDASVNLEMEDGSTPLYAACERGHLNIARELIHRGALVNKFGKFGWTPLTVASRNGHLEIVAELIEHRASVNLAGNRDGVFPLHAACSAGHLSVVRRLIANGARVNSMKRDGATPLHEAAANGHVEIITELMANGASSNQALVGSPLMEAISNGHLEAFAKFVEAGADISPAIFTQSRNNRDSPFYRAIGNGGNVIALELCSRARSLAITNKWTPLFLAAISGSVQELTTLLSSGENILSKNKDGASLLFVAALAGHVDVVRMLLASGNDFDDPKTQSPLRAAAQYGHLAVVAELMQCNQANRTDVDAHWGLSSAAKNDHLEVVRYLLQNGAPVTMPRQRIESPLYAAAANGYDKIVNEILAHFTSTDDTKQCEAALRVAAQNGHLEVVQLLLAHDLGIGRDEGIEALIEAVNNGHAAVVRILLKAAVRLPVEVRTRLLTTARVKGFTGVSKILERNAALFQ